MSVLFFTGTIFPFFIETVLLVKRGSVVNQKAGETNCIAIYGRVMLHSFYITPVSAGSLEEYLSWIFILEIHHVFIPNPT
jgi:hypothetical protein